MRKRSETMIKPEADYLYHCSISRSEHNYELELAQKRFPKNGTQDDFTDGHWQFIEDQIEWHDEHMGGTPE